MLKMQVVGVKVINGLTKANNSPFEISRLFCLVPIETGKFSTITVAGHGFELAEIEFDPASLPQFVGMKFPLTLELLTSQVFSRGKFETIVTGFSLPKDKPVVSIGQSNG